jgi:hypothetical protein
MVDERGYCTDCDSYDCSHATIAGQRARIKALEAERRVPDPEKRDWITRCPRCGGLPRPTLMGRTICDRCGGLDVPQPLDPGLPPSGGTEHG